MRLIPAPRGTGIVSAPVPKKLLTMAGIEDCYTSATGCTGTLGNFGKKILFINFLFCIDVVGVLDTLRPWDFGSGLMRGCSDRLLPWRLGAIASGGQFPKP